MNPVRAFISGVAACFATILAVAFIRGKFEPAPTPWQNITIPFSAWDSGDLSCTVTGPGVPIGLPSFSDPPSKIILGVISTDGKYEARCYFTPKDKPELVDLRPGGVDVNGDVQPLLTDTQGVLMVSVERREELKRVANYLAGKNVLLHYRGKDGRLHEWEPTRSR